MDCAIETERLTGGYGNRMVVCGFAMQVPRGAVYGFLGPNGAGKTTVLRLLLGLLRPAAGSIRVFGQELGAALPGILRRVGSLIEQPSLYEHLTGRENMEIARRLKGLPRDAADQAIQALGIADYAGHAVREYSRGMRQRLGIAMAMLGNPELLVLDEPMNGLDAGGLRTFRELAERLNREHGTTVLVSSHQLQELDRMATHIGIIDDAGELRFQGTRAELSERIPQELVIRVDRREEALRVLSAGGMAVEARRGHFVIHGATQETAREVNRLLVEHGVGVHHLAVELATLQSLFVKVTGYPSGVDSN